MLILILGDIMWFDILKESKQTSRQVGSLNWDEEEIPEKEDENCIKKLLNMYNRAKPGEGTGINSGTKFSLVNRGIEKFPEKLICKALDLFKKMAPKDYKNINEGDFLSRGLGSSSFKKISEQEYVIYVYKLYPRVGSNKLITGFYAFNKGVQVKNFDIMINYFDPSSDGNFELNDARGKHYLDNCKYVFGEYF